MLGTTVGWYFYDHEPIIHEFSARHEAANIVTLGLVDFESGEEKLLFDIKFPRLKNYYYMVNKDQLNKPGLVRKIKNQLKEKHEENLDIGFGIYQSDFDDNFAYCVAYSSYSWDETFGRN